MKKWLGGFLVAGMIVGGSTAAFAADNGNKVLNFGQMVPYMQKAHPEFSKSQLKDMYNDCYSTVGSSQSNNFQDMMPQSNNYQNMTPQSMQNY